MACQLKEAVQEINKLLALPAVNKEKIMVDKLNLAKQSIESQMKLLGAQVKPVYQDNKVDESKTDEYIDNMLYKINPTFKIEKDSNLFEKYLSGEVSGFGHYNSKENKIVIPVLPEFTDRNRLEYVSKILYNRLGFKVKGSDHNYFQKRYGALTEYNTYDMTNWFDKVLKDNPDSVIEYAEGYYTNSTAKGLLNDMVTTGFLSDDILDRVVRHEKIHAYTSKFLHENPEHIVTKDVKRLYREALAKMPKKDNNAYWRKNVDEFVAEAISNPEIRDLLKVIPTEQVNNKASIFDQLVKLLLESLGLKRGNIYSELLYALNNMPTNDIKTDKLVDVPVQYRESAKEQLKQENTIKENAEVSSTFFKKDKDTYYTKEKTNYRKVFIPSEGTPKDKMKYKNILNSLFAAIRSDLSFGNGPRDIHDMFSKYSDIYTKEIKEFIEAKNSLDKGTREMKDIAEWEDFAKEYIANNDKLIELFNKEAEKHGLPKPRLADPVDNYEFGFSAQFLKESTKQEVGKMTTNEINEMALKCAKQG